MKCRFKQKAKVNASIEHFLKRYKGYRTTYILLIMWLARVAKISHFHTGERTRKMEIDETQTQTQTQTHTACDFMLWVGKGNRRIKLQ